MKKIIAILILLSISWKVIAFSWWDLFLKTVDNSCVLATDGCNSYVMKNKQFLRSSSLYCPNKPIIWKCVAQENQVEINNFADVDSIVSKREEQESSYSQKDELLNKNINNTLIDQPQTQSAYLKSQLLPKYVLMVDRFAVKYQIILETLTWEQRKKLENKVQKNLKEKIVFFKQTYKNPKFKEQQIIWLLEYLQIKLQ